MDTPPSHQYVLEGVGVEHFTAIRHLLAATPGTLIYSLHPAGPVRAVLTVQGHHTVEAREQLLRGLSDLGAQVTANAAVATAQLWRGAMRGMPGDAEADRQRLPRPAPLPPLDIPAERRRARREVAAPSAAWKPPAWPPRPLGQED